MIFTVLDSGLRRNDMRAMLNLMALTQARVHSKQTRFVLSNPFQRLMLITGFAFRMLQIHNLNRLALFVDPRLSKNTDVS